MKNKKGKILWLFYALVLVVLFLLSATDLIIKEQKNEIYRLSVIIEDAKDDNYVNFKKGMDQAAIEMNADVSFISLYEGGSSSQQMDLITREIQDGAQALIISPVDELKLAEKITANQISGPLVLLNSQLNGERIAAAITADYYAMGQMVAEAVIREQNRELPVYLFTGRPPAGSSARFQEGILAVLESYGRKTELFKSEGSYDFRRRIEEVVYPGGPHAVIIALDPESLLETAAVLADSSVYASYIDGLYGRGSSIAILNYLDKELITGLGVADEYSTGYLSVRTAIENIEKKAAPGLMIMESHYVKKADMLTPEYEKMLYPIE